MLFYMSFCI